MLRNKMKRIIMQIENLKQKIDGIKALEVSYLIDKGITDVSGEPIQKMDKSEIRL